jgi:phosphoenolpyruvate carboxykinase (GTP)
MCQRVEGKLGAKETPIGNMPLDGDLDLSGLELPTEDLAQLMEVEVEAFKEDVVDAEAYLAGFADKVPARLMAQLEALKSRLG